MSSYRGAEKIGRNYIPPALAGIGKTAVAHFRYQSQLKRARDGFAAAGPKYPNPIMFIAGLPKSGTTWLENLVTASGEITSVMPPQAVAFEQKSGGSHNFELTNSIFSRLKEALVLMKLHCHGSDNNMQILKSNNVPVVALFRDLRDVAVSYIYYVQKTPYHPEHRKYRGVGMNEALTEFGKTLLPAYRHWIESWQSQANEHDLLILRYEDLHADTVSVLGRVFIHFGIPATDEEVSQVVEEKSFKNMSTGTSASKVDSSTFFRKGITGDWVNHFDQANKELFKTEISSLLIDLQYEDDDNW